jgi:hypothetical protein
MAKKPEAADQPKPEVEHEGTMAERIARDTKKMKSAPENKAAD